MSYVCIGCKKELTLFMRVQWSPNKNGEIKINWDFIDPDKQGDRVFICENNNCQRYGLLSVFYIWRSPYPPRAPASKGVE